MVETVALYRVPTTPADADAIADWLRDRVDAEVQVRDRLLGSVDGADALAEALAAARVTDPYDRGTGNIVVGVVRYEERAPSVPERAGGIVYDGRAVQRALNARPPGRRGLDHIHLPPVASSGRGATTTAAGTSAWPFSDSPR